MDLKVVAVSSQSHNLVKNRPFRDFEVMKVIGEMTGGFRGKITGARYPTRDTR